jgi:hypothetical protein
MKRAILIGFVLAMASSSAYAWTKISAQITGSSFGGAAKEWTDKINCNSGAKIEVTHLEPQGSFGAHFHVAGPRADIAYDSMDQAAKAGCNER